MKAIKKGVAVRRFGVALVSLVVFVGIGVLGAERALALSKDPNFVYFEGDPWFTAADVSGHGLSLVALEGEDVFDDFSLTTVTGKLPGYSLVNGYAQDLWTLTNASSMDYQNVLLLITFAYVGSTYNNVGIGTEGLSLVQVGDYFIATFELGDIAAGESVSTLLEYHAPSGFELAPPGAGFTYDPPAVQYLMYATAAPIPEPASALLFGIGVVGLAAYRRRR